MTKRQPLAYRTNGAVSGNVPLPRIWRSLDEKSDPTRHREDAVVETGVQVDVVSVSSLRKPRGAQSPA
ncbi:MAG: hypothetical protein ACK5U8_15760, partial [Deltaproteobacteria bacterium]